MSDGILGCETPSTAGCGGLAGPALQQINVISMEDEEFSSDDERVSMSI